MATAKLKSDPLPHDDMMANGAARVRPLRLTPAWAGRDVSLEEFERASGKEGWQYELIDGRIEVFPTPELPHDMVLQWIYSRLIVYRNAHREVIHYISTHSQVYIPNRREATCLQPALTAYRDDPSRWPLPMRRWRNMNPILVAEVLSERYHKKDLVRNVALSQEAPSVREYWILDPREDTDDPSLRVYRKRGSGYWHRPIEAPFAGTYKTPLLPGFTLIVDPSV
jgi:Uma2 family endonuclease